MSLKYFSFKTGSLLCFLTHEREHHVGHILGFLLIDARGNVRLRGLLSRDALLPRRQLRGAQRAGVGLGGATSRGVHHAVGERTAVGSLGLVSDLNMAAQTIR